MKNFLQLLVARTVNTTGHRSIRREEQAAKMNWPDLVQGGRSIWLLMTLLRIMKQGAKKFLQQFTLSLHRNRLFRATDRHPA